jgi:hypothetical protein
MSEHEARGRAVYDHTNDEPRPSGRRRRQVADWGVGDEVFDHMPRRRFAHSGGADQPRRGDDHDEPPIPRGGADDGRRTIVIGEHSDLPPVAPQRQDDDETFTSREDALRSRAADDALWDGDEPFSRDRRDTVRGGDAPFSSDRRDTVRGGDEPTSKYDAVAAAWASDDQSRGDDVAWRGDDGPWRGDDGPWRGDAPGGPVSDVGPASEVAIGGEELAGEAHRRNGANGRAVARTRVARPTEAVVRGAQGGRRTVKIGGRPGEIPRSERPRRPPRSVSERLGARPDRVAAWAFALGLVLILVAILTASMG